MTLTRLASTTDETWQINAVATLRTAFGRRTGDEQFRFALNRQTAMQTATATGDRADRGAAHLQAIRDFTLRELAFQQQAGNFDDGGLGKHGSDGKGQRAILKK